MNKKASIQLSVNFLVVIIISVVIMGFGFYLVNNMLANSDDTLKSMDEKMQKQIESLLIQEGKPVAIPMVQKTVERGKIGQFGIGVMNLETNPGHNNEFGVSVIPGDIYSLDGKDITNDARHKVLSVPSFELLPNTYDIEKNDVHAFNVVIKVPKDALRGEYIFNVYVCSDLRNGETVQNPSQCGNEGIDLYGGSMYKLYVKVP